MSYTDKLKVELYDEVVNKKNKQYIELSCRLRETCNDIKKKDKEIERLKKREQECIDHYLVQCKYASEMEAKYIIANNIINEFDKWLDEESEKTILSTGHLTCLMMCKNKLQELKGSSMEDK